jgi:hypothetical protein
MRTTFQTKPTPSHRPRPAHDASARKGERRSEVCDFQVIGELKEHPDHLLLKDADGQCYAYDLISGEIRPLQPDESWAVDVTPVRGSVVPAKNVAASRR